MGSFADTSEHRNQVDGPLKEELLSGLRLDIPDRSHNSMSWQKSCSINIKIRKHHFINKAPVRRSGL